MDEFDAIARTRGGKGGSQGDAGVARDSLVNQLLTCLDGIDPPVVPTFVIGLTNKRSLIDPGKVLFCFSLLKGCFGVVFNCIC